MLKCLKSVHHPMDIQGIFLTCRDDSTLSKCPPPHLLLPEVFSQNVKSHINTASDSITRGKCLLNHKFLILKITHWKKPSALPLTFKAFVYSSKCACNFWLTETEDKCFLMPTQYNKVDGRGQKDVYVVPHSTEIKRFWYFSSQF